MPITTRCVSHCVSGTGDIVPKGGGTHHLKTNDATTNDDHPLGHFLECNCAGARDDLLLVDLEAGERRRLATSSDDDVLTPDLGFTAVQKIDLDRVLILEGSGALDVVDLVFLEQKLHTLRQTGDGLVLGLHHLRQVELDISNINATLFRVV